MSQQTGHSSNRVAIISLLVIVMGIVGGGVYWFLLQNDAQKPEEETVAEQVVASFYTALAALDVEQNERAATALKTAIELEPQEPALWANLAVAQMRLRSTEAAQQSLQQAQTLAGDSRELAALKAEVLEQAGQIEAAIEQLREVHQVWPENLSTTFSLVSLLGQIQSDETEAEKIALLTDILQHAPGNLRTRCELARLAATEEREEILRSTLDSLLSEADRWPDLIQKQLQDADEALKNGDFRKTAVSLTFFENLLKPRPEYQYSLAELGAGSGAAIGTPLRSFLRLQLPSAQSADADLELTFSLESAPKRFANSEFLLAFASSQTQSSTLLAINDDTLKVGQSTEIPLPGSLSKPHTSCLCTADLNFDFREDLVVVGDQSCRILLGQADGSYLPTDVSFSGSDQAWASVFSVDVEADGDLDILLSNRESPLRWIRNNGDMTFTAIDDFLPIDAVLDLQTCDLDGDGTVDLVTIDATGTVSVWRNQRGGNFVPMPSPFADSQLAVAIGDVDRNGQFDIVAISNSGEMQSASWNLNETWSRSVLASWPTSHPLTRMKPGEVFLAIADIDNNGGTDLVASVEYETRIWLRTTDGEWAQAEEKPNLKVTSIVDHNDDGLLDLVGHSQADGKIATNQSQKGYGWHVIKPRANKAPGDQRINSFGIGGQVTVRAGNLAQSAAIRSPMVHFGLGNRTRADVARIVWPNGTVQAEFELEANQELIAEQRLKGSCPWVFTHDGTQYRFIKDFIWRSPLGLRINAQTTAGVTQTEDWIKIPGDHLAPRNDQYSVRITAELWETHFFDHVALLAVDHPAETEIYVDERFVPNQPPIQKVFTTTKPEPFENPINHNGQPLDEHLHSIDEIYADQFALGNYQGVAEDHWIEFTIPDKVATDRTVRIVGHGWIYPTDSSLNVALGQQDDLRPYGLILERQPSNGHWEIVNDNLGFPAGKNKNVLIEVPTSALSDSRRFRLRTNMEIYWDFLGWSYQIDDVEPTITKLPLQAAELRQRGYSKLKPIHRRRPDTPFYDVESVGQRWLDLEGYYTRFGDVRELLKQTDDRYVIMNAGDELAFEFSADTGPKITAGYQRDFVLVGDGWVKDGDFNTAFSRTVRPLPTHEDPNYNGPLGPLGADPVYQKHANDWQTYHTRYITPGVFQHGLR